MIDITLRDPLGHSYLSTWYLAVHRGNLAHSTGQWNVMAQDLAIALCSKLSKAAVKMDSFWFRKVLGIWFQVNRCGLY